jgi:alpha-galactosidase
MHKFLSSERAPQTSIILAAALAGGLAVACAGSSSGSGPGGGGSGSGVGGSANGGSGGLGASGMGGSKATGGAPGSGGSRPGGSSGLAGASGTGGGRASGGTVGSGGSSSAGAGGAAGVGGRTVAGGTAGTGGIAGTTGAGGSMSPELLASKPSMGWESWWSGHTGVATEAEIKATADAMASKLLPYGYNYILIDDGWYDGFDQYGRLKPDLQKFPDGWSGTAAYVHSKGLKIGIYLTPGVNDTVVAANSPIEGTSYHVRDIVTSAAGNTDQATGATARKIDYSKPGAIEFVQGYANLISGWGADHVKMDFVGPGGGGGNADNQDDIMQWRAALNDTGRQIWLNLSNKLSLTAISTWQHYSNAWRIENDVECYCSTDTNWAHVVREINGLPPFAQYGGPGHWNDLDSLMIGNGSFDGITADERQTMFSFWAIAASPLIIGADITKLDAADLAILTNSEVIAVNQAAIAPQVVSNATNQQVWYAKQKDGSIVVGLFNFDSTSAKVTATFGTIGAGSSMNVRDLVERTDLGMSTGSFSAMLATHASRLLRLTAP